MQFVSFNAVTRLHLWFQGSRLGLYQCQPQGFECGNPPSSLVPWGLGNQDPNAHQFQCGNPPSSLVPWGLGNQDPNAHQFQCGNPPSSLVPSIKQIMDTALRYDV